MARKNRLPKVTLSEEQHQKLETISKSRTASLRVIQRATIILLHNEGHSIDAEKNVMLPVYPVEHLSG